MYHPHTVALCLTIDTNYRLQRSGLISMYHKSICLNLEIGLGPFSRADFYNTFYVISVKSQINACIGPYMCEFKQIC